MIEKIYDFYTPEKLMEEQILAELSIRTPEELAKGKEDCRRMLNGFIERDTKFWANHKKAASQQRIKDFTTTSDILRKFAERHSCIFKVSITEEWQGYMELQFLHLFFMDIDPTDSNREFAAIFEQFQDISVSIKDEKIRIQIFADLYDVIEVVTL